MMEFDQELTDWLDGRTVGYSNFMGGWHWRGPGYDEGWAQMEESEVRKLSTFLIKRYTSY